MTSFTTVLLMVLLAFSGGATPRHEGQGFRTLLISGCGDNGTLSAACANASTTVFPSTSTTSTSLRTIYTSSANYTPAAPTIFVYSLEAGINRVTRMAEYSFQFIIKPDWNAMICRASLPAPDARRLPDVPSAQCLQQDMDL